MEYTFTFDKSDEGKFREVLSRLEDNEYTIIQDVHLVEPDKPAESDHAMVIDMDPEAALTFRLGMKFVKIRRARSEEELAAEKARDDRHKVKVTIHTPMGGPATP